MIRFRCTVLHRSMEFFERATDIPGRPLALRSFFRSLSSSPRLAPTGQFAFPAKLPAALPSFPEYGVARVSLPREIVALIRKHCA